MKLSRYKRVMDVNDLFNKIGLLSWNTKRLREEFPITLLKEDQYEDYFHVASEYLDELISLGDKAKEIKLLT